MGKDIPGFWARQFAYVLLVGTSLGTNKAFFIYVQVNLKNHLKMKRMSSSTRKVSSSEFEAILEMESTLLER